MNEKFLRKQAKELGVVLFEKYSPDSTNINDLWKYFNYKRNHNCSYRNAFNNACVEISHNLFCNLRKDCTMTEAHRAFITFYEALQSSLVDASNNR